MCSRNVRFKYRPLIPAGSKQAEPDLNPEECCFSVRSRSDCSARPAVADVCGQRRMQHLDGLEPERVDAVEDPLAGAKKDRRYVERELVDDAGNDGLAHSR